MPTGRLGAQADNTVDWLAVEVRADAEGPLRNYDYAMKLNSVLADGYSLAAAGAGRIGPEVATGARQRGVNVTAVETASQPLQAALGERVGAVSLVHRADYSARSTSSSAAEPTPPICSPRS